MKWVLIILGVLIFLVGAVWILQGANVLTQGMMAGHRRWIAIGSVLDVVGIVLVLVGATRKARVKSA